MSAASDPQAALRDFAKAHEFFVGIDSDGCVFDTMEVKHKESDYGTFAHISER